MKTIYYSFINFLQNSKIQSIFFLDIDIWVRPAKGYSMRDKSLGMIFSRF